MVAMACNFLPHNLCEVAQAIYDYMDNKEPMLPGPDFPTGGLIINANDIPNIMQTGRGSVQVRGKYRIEKNSIVFYELPYGVTTEALIDEIVAACETEKVNDIIDIRDESTRKSGFRLVLECAKHSNINKIISQLFKNTNLQVSISYNQIALVDKTPTELNLKQCIEIYVKHNIDCIIRELKFDIQKVEDKLHILNGLLKALEDIDNVIKIIKESKSAATAKVALIDKYNFSEIQADAIINMKLGKLAGLEKIEVQQEAIQAENELNSLRNQLNNPQKILRDRLAELVKKYGDARRTELVQLDEPEDEESEKITPKECTITLTKDGIVKRTVNKVSKRIKSANDVVISSIKTNTINNLMIFTNQGNMYRLLVNDIPETAKGVLIKDLISLKPDERVEVICDNTDIKYIVFATARGRIKRTPIDEYICIKRKSGVKAVGLDEDDKIVTAFLNNDESIIVLTKNGCLVKLKSTELTPTGRTTKGLKAIAMDKDDEVVAAMPIKNEKNIMIFNKNGNIKQIDLKQIMYHGRNTRGTPYGNYKETIGACLTASEEDNILIIGDKTICDKAKNILSEDNKINLIIGAYKI